MKQLFPGLLIALSVILYSCGDNATTAKKEQSPAEQAAPEENSEVKLVKASFTNVDVNAMAFIKKLTDSYLQIKNALTAGKATGADDAAKNFEETIKGFDKSLLSADQKQAYDVQEAGLKENAEHVANSPNDIEQQRAYFSNMSDGMYALVKAFGGGKTLYHDHCPMAKNGKGAMWLSETKEIKNPYFGDKMMECGSVEEEIQ